MCSHERGGACSIWPITNTNTGKCRLLGAADFTKEDNPYTEGKNEDVRHTIETEVTLQYV